MALLMGSSRDAMHRYTSAPQHVLDATAWITSLYGRAITARSGSGTAWCARAAGGRRTPPARSTSTIWPASMSTMRFATWRAKPISWLTTSMVMPSRGEPDHGVEHLLDHLRIERRGRLVEQHDLRLHAERARDRDALLLAAGKLRRIFVGLLGNAHAREIVPRDLLGLACFGMLRTQIGASVQFSSTVRCGNRLNCWNTMPTSRRTSSIVLRSSVSSMPSTMTRPRCQFSSRLMQRSSVDLPLPDGPQITMRSPRMTLRLTSRSTWNCAEPFVAGRRSRPRPRSWSCACRARRRTAGGARFRDRPRSIAQCSPRARVSRRSMNSA